MYYFINLYVNVTEDCTKYEPIADIPCQIFGFVLFKYKHYDQITMGYKCKDPKSLCRKTPRLVYPKFSSILSAVL